MNITAIKTGGVPEVSLAIIKGSVTIGDNTYLFTNGQTTIKPVSNVDIQAYSEDRMNALTAFASLMGRLPLSTSDPSSDIGPSKSRQAVTILIGNESWILNYFSGSMSVSTPYEIRAQTEKTTYDFGDSVRITGNVTRHDEQVLINVINPEGESFTFITVPISSDKNFNAEFILKQTTLAPNGIWTIRLNYADNISTEIKFNVGKSATYEQTVNKIGSITGENIANVKVQAKQIKDLIIIRVRNMADNAIDIHSFKIIVPDSSLKAFKGPGDWTKEDLLDNGATFSATDDPIKVGDKGYFLLRVDDVKPIIQWEVYGLDNTPLTEGSVTPFMR